MRRRAIPNRDDVDSAPAGAGVAAAVAAAVTTGAPTVSVVATVLNERATVERLLDSLAGQSRRPDEVVIVDGGSTDGTLAALETRAARGDLPLRVLSRPGAGISAGRNAAIRAATGPVIACTDAGVRLSPGWLAQLTAPFADGAGVVSGFFASAPETPFETALGATTLPEVREIDPRRFLPSSRSVAFRKDGWAAAGGYPEWLDYCEDLVFDFRLLAAVGPATFAPEALVYFRPRATLRAFFRQYYRYARGDGKANLWPGRHAVRYGVYAAALVMALAAFTWRQPLVIGLLLAGFGFALRHPYARLRRQWGHLPPAGRLAAASWVPLVRVTGDVAKMLGYPPGLAWRWRRRPPAWRPSPELGRF